MVIKYPSVFEIGNSSIRDIFYRAYGMKPDAIPRFSLRKIEPQILPKLVRYIADTRKRKSIEKTLKEKTLLAMGYQGRWFVNIEKIARNFKDACTELNIVDSVELVDPGNYLIIKHPVEKAAENRDAAEKTKPTLNSTKNK